MRHSRVALAGLSLSIVATLTLLSAPGAAQTVSFETASVKANRSSEDSMSAGRNGSRYIAVNAPLKFLLVTALGVGLDPSRLIGGPDWVDTERFDIVAAMPAGAQPADLPRMLRTLLEQRFHLVVRAETREIPIFALRLARPDGKLGPRLTSSAQDCATLAGRGAGGRLPPQADGRPTCRVSLNGQSIRGGGTTMATLATVLPQYVQRRVEDRTGLAGTFDFDLDFSTDVRTPAATPLAGDPPSIFTALQEQLGVKLESTRAPAEIFVIEQVSRPTPD